MKQYLRMQEVVKKTGFHRRTLMRHIQTGKLKCFLPNGSNEYRFTEKQIKNFMEQGEFTGK